MVTIVSTSPAVQLLPLCCPIPVEDAQPSPLPGIAVPTERTLTLQPFAKRVHLPDAVLDSPALRLALENGSVQVLKEAPMAPTQTQLSSPAATKTQQKTAKKSVAPKRPATPRKDKKTSPPTDSKEATRQGD